MLLDKTISGIDLSNLEDHSVIMIEWKNDGLYMEGCVNTPIIDRRNKKETPIGAITFVSDEIVKGVIWNKYIDGLTKNDIYTTVSVELDEFGKEVMCLLFV